MSFQPLSDKGCSGNFAKNTQVSEILDEIFGCEKIINKKDKKSKKNKQSSKKCEKFYILVENVTFFFWNFFGRCCCGVTPGLLNKASFPLSGARHFSLPKSAAAKIFLLRQAGRGVTINSILVIDLAEMPAPSSTSRREKFFFSTLLQNDASHRLSKFTKISKNVLAKKFGWKKTSRSIWTSHANHITDTTSNPYKFLFPSWQKFFFSHPFSDFPKIRHRVRMKRIEKKRIDKKIFPCPKILTFSCLFEWPFIVTA